MADVFLVQVGQLTQRSLRDLRKAGVVVAEVEDVSKASFIRASEIVSADDMLWAALDAVKRDDSYQRVVKSALADNLLRVVLESRQ